MQWFYNLKISKKLMIAFLVVAIIAAIVGYVGITKIKAIDKEDTRLYQEHVVPMESINNLAVAFQMRRVQLKDILLKDDLSERQQTVNRINELDEVIKQNMLIISEQNHKTAIKKRIAELRDALQSYETVKNEYIRLVMDNRIHEATVITSSGQGVAATHVVESALENLTQTMINLAKQDSDQNSLIASRANSTMIALIFAAISLALLLGWFIARSISRPIQEMVEAADKLALGDINVQIETLSRDEVGILTQSFKAVIENIRQQALVAEKIAAGEIDVQVQAKSDEDVLARSMNMIITALQNLIQEMDTLTQAAVAGKLDTRGDIYRFNGSYREIIMGVNHIIDGVVEPIKESAGILHEMAQGNLQLVMTGEYRGDFNAIKNALNSTLHSLNEILGEINEASGQVASGSGQVAESSQSLSQASTEQASSVQEITATMTEISTQTKQNALSANRANEMALEAKENAIIGNREMQGMMQAMNDINESSNSIAKIIKVIDEIAFQTNILALNAAVEAARAGQHGKGFAVVAEEVRNLAARSANAAKETTVMIEGSINKVELGTKMAFATAEALNKITDGVGSVAGLVGDIAVASNEQATAIAEINQGIAGIAEVTQMNTATSQQSAAASEELASQAELLKNLVSRFKLARPDPALQSITGLSPELIKMLEGMSRNNISDAGAAQVKDMQKGAIPRPLAKINLDVSSFGKY